MDTSLRVAVLLVACGGSLDAYAWLAQGHVFTNAQTGNIVLFAVFAAQGDWVQALRHVPPMLAFLPGISAAQLLRDRTSAWGEARVAVAIIGIEIAVLAVVALLPSSFPQWPGVVAIAFAAAMQNSGFERVGKVPYTSVVTTGNLRSAGEAFYGHVFPHRRPDPSHKVRVLAALCGAFAAGAAMGAVATAHLGRAAIAGPLLLLAMALGWQASDARVAPTPDRPSPGNSAGG